MITRKSIEQRVNETMDSLSGIRRAQPQPFFYTRLQARLERRRPNVWEGLTRMITRPAIAILSVTIVVFLNAFVIVSESTAQLPDQSEVAVAEEYHHANSFYDVENTIR